MLRFKRLLGFVHPYAGVLALTFLAAVVASVLDGLSFALLIPFLRVLFDSGSGVLAADPTVVERALDSVFGWAISANPSTALRNVVFVILGTVAVKNVAAYTAGSLSAYIQEGVARDLRAAVYGHIQKMGLGFLQRMKSGQLVARILADTDQARRIVSSALVSAFQNLILIVVYLTILFLLSWRLTLVTLVLAPLIALAMRPIIKRVRRRIKAALHDRGEMTAIVSETVDGARLVKAHGAEGYEHRRFLGTADKYMGEVVKAQRFVVLAHPVSETLGAAVILTLVVGMSAGAGIDGGMRPEIFLPFLAVTLRLMSPVKALSQFPMSAEVSLVAADRLFEIIDTEPDDVDPPDAKSFPGLEDRIVFEKVSFAYDPDCWALRDVDLEVPMGSVVAIVGPSGAGKSTLVDLLPRFIDPQEGAVVVDGTPITDYSRKSLRQSLGIVSQHTVIFNDTVRANIAYGEQENADLDSIKSAATAANAAGFIERLPEGYDTVLGERGMRLSGGERQRIAIARALLRDPPILILDEATSSLDTESERLVQQAVARLLERRTVLVIAHRLSTIRRANQIVVMNGGRVVERGTHEELINSKGLYHRLNILEGEVVDD